MKTHYLKTDSRPFHFVITGKKKGEIRKNDRNFQVGDTLVLRETYNRFMGITTGREVSCLITHKQEGYGLPKGYVMLSIELTGSENA